MYEMKKSYKDILTLNKTTNVQLLGKSNTININDYNNDESDEATISGSNIGCNPFDICDDVWLKIIYFVCAEDVISIKQSCSYFNDLFSMKNNNFRLKEMNRYWKHECYRICSSIPPNYKTDNWYKLFIDIFKILYYYYYGKHHYFCCLYSDHNHQNVSSKDNKDKSQKNGNYSKASTITVVDYPFKTTSKKSDLIHSMYYGSGEVRTMDVDAQFSNEEVGTLLSNPNGDDMYCWACHVCDEDDDHDQTNYGVYEYIFENECWDIYNTEFGDDENGENNKIDKNDRDENYLKYGRLLVTQERFEYGRLQNWLKDNGNHCPIYMTSSDIKSAMKFPKHGGEVSILICKYKALSLLKMIMFDTNPNSRYSRFEYDILKHSAKYGCIDIFRFVFENWSNLTKCQLFEMIWCFYTAIIGGNNEIIGALINYIASKWVDEPQLVKKQLLNNYVTFCDWEWSWIDDIQSNQYNVWLDDVNLMYM